MHSLLSCFRWFCNFSNFLLLVPHKVLTLLKASTKQTWLVCVVYVCVIALAFCWTLVCSPSLMHGTEETSECHLPHPQSSEQVQPFIFFLGFALVLFYFVIVHTENTQLLPHYYLPPHSTVKCCFRMRKKRWAMTKQACAAKSMAEDLSPGGYDPPSQVSPLCASPSQCTGTLGERELLEVIYFSFNCWHFLLKLYPLSFYYKGWTL